MDYPIRHSLFLLKYALQITQSGSHFLLDKCFTDYLIRKVFCSYQMSYELHNPKHKLNVVFNLYNCVNL